MFKNYLVTAFNNLFKNKLYSAINIVGLAVGLAACILIALYVQDELSYDKHWDNAERIFRINNEITYPGSDGIRTPSTPLAALPALKSFFSEEIVVGSRIRAVGTTDMSINNEVYPELLAFVDREFADIFKVEAISGSVEATLDGLNNIALSEELATKFFGSTDAIGEIISVPPSYMAPARDYRVTAIYRVANENSRLSIPALALLDEDNMPEDWQSWDNSVFVTYIKLADNVSVEQVNGRFSEFLDLHVNLSSISSAAGDYAPSDIMNYRLQPVTDLYLDPWSESDKQNSGSRIVNLIFIAIAGVVLAIGCLNFSVLTLARSTKREREVAIRKVLGAKRSSLLIQFVGEAILIVLLASILGLVLLELVMPVYANYTGKILSLDYSLPSTYLSLAALVLTTGALGGLYPAAVLSGFKPLKSLGNSHTVSSARGYSLKDILVVLQFTISVSLIVATAFVYLQSRFASSNNLGFNPNNLMVVQGVLNLPELQQGLGNKGIVLQQQVNSIEGVSGSGLSMLIPGAGGSFSRQLILQPEFGVGNTTTNIVATTRLNFIDADFFDAYEISIIAGRSYDEAFQQDHIPLIAQAAPTGQSYSFNLVINESAVQELGLSSPEDAIGRVVRTNVGAIGTIMADLTIVGVVADSRFHYVRTEIPPEAYFLTPELGANLTVRFQGNPQDILNSVAQLWPSLYGDTPIRTLFMDQIMDDQFADVQTQGSMLAGFSLLAVMLACLGLLGMSTFVIERRTKEIGLRKVMGAKVKDVVRLLLWQFSMPVLIANVIAWPFTVFFMIRWLEGFSNRIDSIWLLPLCLAVGVLSLIFMWITVAGNTTRIARRSPIHALRYE
ncbi:MAG: hypothetical protein COB20_12820 [SAR86 cluster bacterium]|uniref:ABC transporter permease n=1 Tax=SAR86 cluster bacterium TaxID=2030880 RepID=A0A2A4WYZ2_9GAMM|nr:MAG: hypothetical protein COB20_12820 [SAR86 cluster bacterium]